MSTTLEDQILFPKKLLADDPVLDTTMGHCLVFDDLIKKVSKGECTSDL